MTLFFQQDQYLYELPQKYTDVTHRGCERGLFLDGFLSEQQPGTARKLPT